MILLGGGHAVDIVVGGHDRPWIGILDRDLERQQVQLPQRGFAEDAVDRISVGL
jgi:hypothetical protein